MKAALVLLVALSLFAVVLPGATQAHIGFCRADDGLCQIQCVQQHATTPPPHLCLPILP
jgi:hypothetical protein